MPSDLSAVRPSGRRLASSFGGITRLPLLLFALTLAAGVSSASAGAPANDDFPGIPISSLPFTDSQNTQDATVEPGEPASECLFGLPAAATVWYTYTPSADGVLAASTAGSDFDLLLAVWTQSSFPGGGLAEVGCTDPFNGQTTVAVEVEAGRTYYFQIGGFEFGDPTGQLSFHLEAGVPATNDDIAQATVIGSLPFNDTTLTTGTDTEDMEPSPTCLMGEKIRATVWYAYTPSADGILVADMTGTSYYAVVTALTGVPGDFTQVACTIVSPGEGGALGFRVQGGIAYHLQIGGFAFDGQSPSGFLELTLDTFDLPPCPTAEFTVNDPSADAFPSMSRGYDAVSTSVGSDGQHVCIEVQLADPLLPGAVKVDDWFAGVLVMDLDQNENTGFQEFFDDLCRAPSGLGVDAFTSFSLDGGLIVPVADLSFEPFFAPQTKYAVFIAEEDSFKIIVPATASGDDLFSFVLIIGNYREPTDCAPNSGSLTSTSPQLKFGDIDCDDSASAVDSLKILRFIAGLSIAQQPGCPLPDDVVAALSGFFADLNCDGSVNAVDALALLRHVADLPVNQHQPCQPIGDPV